MEDARASGHGVDDVGDGHPVVGVEGDVAALTELGLQRHRPHRGVVGAEANDLAHLVVVHPLQDGRDEDDPRSGGGEVVDGAQLHVDEVLSTSQDSRRLGSKPVELEVHQHLAFGDLVGEAGFAASRVPLELTIK